MAFRFRLLPFALAIGLAVPAALSIAKTAEEPDQQPAGVADADITGVDAADVAVVVGDVRDDHPIRHPLPRPSPIRPIGIG